MDKISEFKSEIKFKNPKIQRKFKVSMAKSVLIHSNPENHHLSVSIVSKIENSKFSSSAVLHARAKSDEITIEWHQNSYKNCTWRTSIILHNIRFETQSICGRLELHSKRKVNIP
jgi:hypothetical protein